MDLEGEVYDMGSNVLFSKINELDQAKTIFDHEPFFEIDISNKAKIKILFLAGLFKSRFTGGVISAVSPKLISLDLKRTTNSLEVLSKLGGAANVAITTHDLHNLLQKQHDGGPGFLLNRGPFMNFLYVSNFNSNTWEFSVHWGGPGWIVLSFEHDSRDKITAGHRVIVSKFDLSL